MSDAHAAEEEQLRAALSGEHPFVARFRRVMGTIPKDPRCKLCLAPFGGAGGAGLKHFGFQRFPGNPAICVNCVTSWSKMGVKGAEIEVSLLFADIRG